MGGIQPAGCSTSNVYGLCVDDGNESGQLNGADSQLSRFLPPDPPAQGVRIGNFELLPPAASKPSHGVIFTMALLPKNAWNLMNPWGPSAASTLASASGAESSAAFAPQAEALRNAAGESQSRLRSVSQELLKSSLPEGLKDQLRSFVTGLGCRLERALSDLYNAAEAGWLSPVGKEQSFVRGRLGEFGARALVSQLEAARSLVAQGRLDEAGDSLRSLMPREPATVAQAVSLLRELHSSFNAAARAVWDEPEALEALGKLQAQVFDAYLPYLSDDAQSAIQGELSEEEVLAHLAIHNEAVRGVIGELNTLVAQHQQRISTLPSVPTTFTSPASPAVDPKEATSVRGAEVAAPSSWNVQTPPALDIRELSRVAGTVLPVAAEVGIMGMALKLMYQLRPEVAVIVAGLENSLHVRLDQIAGMGANSPTDL